MMSPHTYRKAHTQASWVHMDGVHMDGDLQKLAGANLAWRDLRVRGCSTNTLLDGLTGYAEPGSLTAILGPSGSGKSTLLAALAGRLSKTCTETGEIFLNGKKRKLSHGVAAYVTRDDALLGALTVHETIMFTAFLRLPDSMPKKEKMELVDQTIKDMGLQEVAHTAIGNCHLKGCSAGERRRVSIAVELLTKPSLLFLDEPTSSLDSAAAFFVTTTLRNLAVEHGRTVIACFHQPSSEVFELFDSLCLLSEGKSVYFGSATGAHQHFADSGLPCPPRRNPADHFLRAINLDFDRVAIAFPGSLNSNKEDLEQINSLNAMSAADRVEILVSHYRWSESAVIADKKAREISQMVPSPYPYLHAPGMITSNNPATRLRFANVYTDLQDGSMLEPFGTEASTLQMQTFILTWRSIVNMLRDLRYFWLRLLLYFSLCLTLGTVFLQVGYDYNTIQPLCSSSVVAFFTFMAFGSFPSFVEEMKVFTRERLNGYYRVAGFVISSFVTFLPFVTVTAVVSGPFVYILARLHSSFILYIYFVFIICSATAVVERLMYAIASMAPNFVVKLDVEEDGDLLY